MIRFDIGDMYLARRDDSAIGTQHLRGIRRVDREFDFDFDPVGPFGNVSHAVFHIIHYKQLLTLAFFIDQALRHRDSNRLVQLRFGHLMCNLLVSPVEIDPITYSHAQIGWNRDNDPRFSLCKADCA
ncbi:hypothetical protein D3C81_803160 [compost metagenome]